MATRTTGAARWFAETVFQGPTREQSTNIVVSTTATVVAKQNPDRVGLVIMNIGSADAFLNFTSDILQALGIKLTQLGGAITLTVRDDFTFCTREWQAITQAASTSIQVLELFADVLLVPEQK